MHTGFDKVLVHSLTKKPALTQYLSESHVRAARGNVTSPPPPDGLGRRFRPENRLLRCVCTERFLISATDINAPSTHSRRSQRSLESQVRPSRGNITTLTSPPQITINTFFSPQNTINTISTQVSKANSKVFAVTLGVTRGRREGNRNRLPASERFGTQASRGQTLALAGAIFD